MVVVFGRGVGEKVLREVDFLLFVYLFFLSFVSCVYIRVILKNL